MRAIFLDKDGTLVKNVPYNVDPALVTLYPYVAQGLRLLLQHGYALFVVSNQEGIAKGLFSEDSFRRLQQHLHRLLIENGIALNGFYYCPHSPDGNIARYAMRCACRKPMPGMIYRAASEHAVDLKKSWMIGDILNDVEAGRRAGCKTVLIDNGNEKEWLLSALRTPDLVATDFYAAASAIVMADARHIPNDADGADSADNGETAAQ